MSSAYKPTGRKTCRIQFIDQYGQRQIKGTKIRDKRVAEALAQVVENDAARIRAGLEPNFREQTGPYLDLGGAVKTTDKEWEEAIEAYFEEGKRLGHSASHQKEGKSRLKKAREWGKWVTMRDVEKGQVGEYLRHLAAEGKAARSQNHARKHLRLFFAFCVQEGWMNENFAEDTKAVPLTRSTRTHLRRALAVEELGRVLSSAEEADRDYRAARHGGRQVLYAVAAFAGYRRSELLRLVKEDCTPIGEKPRWHVPAERTKNGLAVRLPMTPECAAALREHWLRLGPGEALFKTAPNMKTWRRDLKRAGIVYKDSRGRVADFHALRYTFCA